MKKCTQILTENVANMKFRQNEMLCTILFNIFPVLSIADNQQQANIVALKKRKKKEKQKKKHTNK